MALTLDMARMMEPYVRNAKVLSLGYPDFLLTPEQTQELFGIQPTRFTSHGDWHGMRIPIPETEEVFSLLGSSFDCVDIVASRGKERILDLNYPQDLGQYDLVIDAGTIEHCFNIGQAMFNAANAVKTGGRIFHGPPLTMLNHGFFCIMPTMLHDFYIQNGWEIELMQISHNQKLHDCPRTGRFKAPPEASVFCLAKRLSSAGLVFPIQSKYLKNPNLVHKKSA